MWLAWLGCMVVLAVLCGCDATPCGQQGGAACSTGRGDAGTGAGWDEERRFPLPRGIIVEAEVAMSEGATLDVNFESTPAAVAWNIHTHDIENGPRYREGRDASGNLTFTAPLDATYWALWTNDQSETVEIDVHLHGSDGAAFRGWR